MKSEDGHPLTRLQLSQNQFKTKMNESSQQELLNILLAYSSIDSVDIAQICQMRFANGEKHKLNSVCIEMNRYLQDNTFFRNVSIVTNKVGNFSMENIVTRHRYHIWNKYLVKYPRLIPEHEFRKIGMSAKDVSDLIKGTKLHHRLSQQHQNVEDYELSSDDDSDDPDFNPGDINAEFMDSQDEDKTDVSDDESVMDAKISIVSTTSVGDSCI